MPDQLLDSLSIPARQQLWEERIATGAVTVLVAMADLDVCGWIVVAESRDPDARAEVAEILALYVDPPAWRGGAGSRLWDEAKKRLLGRDITEVTLWVLEANNRARQFYEAVGFQLEPGKSKEFANDAATLPGVRYRTRIA